MRFCASSHVALPGRQQNRGPLVFARGRAALTVRAAASPAAAEKPKLRPGEKKGFVEEMRFVAMKLHTKDQAPKEGGKEASQHPMQQWQPTRQGYLNFLAESKQVYDTLERLVEEAPQEELAKFRSTGLERSEALGKDLAWFKQEHRLEPQPAAEDGPGRNYSRLLERLAQEDPQAFLCHFYNIYFAHSAGGRMIGTKVASMILNRKELEFYRYDGDYKPMLENVRDRLNEVAASWTREQKDHCLEETEKSFKVRELEHSIPAITEWREASPQVLWGDPETGGHMRKTRRPRSAHARESLPFLAPSDE